MVTCKNCHEARRQTEYGKHSCVLLKKIDDNGQALAAVHWILEVIQEEQLRQSTEIQRLARELQRHPHATERQEDATRQQELRQPHTMQGVQDALRRMTREVRQLDAIAGRPAPELRQPHAMERQPTDNSGRVEVIIKRIIIIISVIYLICRSVWFYGNRLL
jgi:hypothetical protein